MADTDSDQEQVKQPVEDDDFDALEGPPRRRQRVDPDETDEIDDQPQRRQRVDPDEADEFDAWRSERRSRGRKRRRHGDDRLRQPNDFDEV